MLASAGALVAMAWSAAGAARAATKTATFTGPGEYSFTVPAGVRSLTVIAIGAAGGDCPVDQKVVGGEGAALTGSVPVIPDETLFVGIGSPGAPCHDGGAPGGSGGGGPGGNAGFGGAGGGGATVVGVPSPSPALGPQLLVVAGAGGGAAQDANGGAAGASGQNPGGGGGGGGPGSSTAGGGGGAGAFGGPGAAGSFGVGGAGGGGTACMQPRRLGAGGGGGGGYFGGGGGGCGAPPGAGGGGSSFVVPGGDTLLGPTPTPAAAAVSITYPAPSADLSSSALSFSGQSPGTASPEQILTVSNKGAAPLAVSGVQLGGAQPDDFLVDNRCQQPVAVGSSCQVGVRFDPQAGGDRSATLKVLSNSYRATPLVALTGSGTVALPRPEPSAVEVVSCRASDPGTTVNRQDVLVNADLCTGDRVDGELELPTTRDRPRATIARGSVVYATGTSIPMARGGSELLLTTRRALKPGSYTLILRNWRGRRWVTRRLPILIG